ncbi:MAG: glycosyltransferase [Desulfobacterales bacterium]
MFRPNVSIAIPCYNEELRLPVQRFRDFAEKEDNYRFLFVDDGSTDRTADILQALQVERPDRFSVMRLGRNFGKAEAVRQGFMASFDSAVEFIGFWDADLSTPLEALPSCVMTFQQRPSVEMVFGSRVKLMGWDIRRHALRHYVGRCCATAVSLILGLPIYDTQCGAKVFRVTDTLRKIFAEAFRTKWLFDVELIARFIQENKTLRVTELERRIYELPLPVWHDVPGSKIRPIDFVTALIDLIRIYRSLP